MLTKRTEGVMAIQKNDSAQFRCSFCGKHPKKILRSTQTNCCVCYDCVKDCNKVIIEVLSPPMSY